MAFKKSSPASTAPDSPEKLIRDLPRRKIPDALPHQQKVMSSYAATALNAPDVALQLPTGSGKTLVGLMIAEWLRRRNQDRVVYLCPTKQLVNQVVSQAERYGLSVVGLTGSARNYDSQSKSAYKTAEKVAITTYSSLFNTNPFFDDAQVIIFDDAHAAEAYVANLWSVKIQRLRTDHAALYSALCGVLRPHLDPTDFSRLTGNVQSIGDKSWVDKLPTPLFAELRNEIADVIDAHAGDMDVGYSWSMIKDHLEGCHFYLSPNEILIRPLIPPTWSHPPFADARQRIYMSATLGAGGDLERLMGRKTITRLSVPAGWDRQGVGRRFFIFPEMSLTDVQVVQLRDDLMKLAGRSVVLVPSDNEENRISSEVQSNLGFPTFSADDIEASKEPFINEDKAVAIVANRYDGIDFPGDQCRLLFIEGQPKATNLQEKFLMSRMGSTVILNERIQTRVLQAIGRCTRGLEDFSAVVVTGQDLPDYLSDIKRRKFLHPELQAEISFGVEQSKNMSRKDIVENFETFLENGEDWEEVNEQIVEERARATQQAFPAMADLTAVVDHEVEYQMRMWQGDYEAALAAAESVLGGLTSSELKGYRAAWHYFAGTAAWYAAKSNAKLGVKARNHFTSAKEAANRISWLVELARHHGDTTKVEPTSKAASLTQIEKIENILAELGTSHDRAYSKYEKEILTGLAGDSKAFEQAHKALGSLLGFDAGLSKVTGAPDPWWMAKSDCFVFEDHSDADATSELSVTKARQASSHPVWIKETLKPDDGCHIMAVLVTPVTKAHTEALPHLSGVAIWPLKDFLDWVNKALSCVRELRKTFVEPGDLDWRAKALEKMEEQQIAVAALKAKLQKMQGAFGDKSASK
jgi:hypothetical protein